MRRIAFVGVAFAAAWLLPQVGLPQDLASLDPRGYVASSGGQPGQFPTPAQQPLMPIPETSPMGSVVADAACCPSPAWKCGGELYGELLYIRPSNDRVPVAVPINGAIVPPPGAGEVQAGNTALVDVDFKPAFRLGGSWDCGECARVGVGYTRFEGTDHLASYASAPVVLRSMVSHPGTFSAPTDFLEALADYDIQFQFADADYRRILALGDRYRLNYVVGARYAHLDERFNSTLSNSTTVETVNTRIRFDGGGLRLGLEGERYAPCCSGWMIYGCAAASLLGGVSHGDYIQRNNIAAVDPLVVNGWSEDRLVPILEIEAGIGWSNASGCFRVKAGYMVTSWFNTPTTDRFINAVHANQVEGIASTLTFDGLNIRTEYRF